MEGKSCGSLGTSLMLGDVVHGKTLEADVHVVLLGMLLVGVSPTHRELVSYVSSMSPRNVFRVAHMIDHVTSFPRVDCQTFTVPRL
jgi:hypothetical protein